MIEYKTGQRGILMNFLQKNPDRQFTARDIAEQLQAEKISISAIYRNLVLLENAGLITRFVKNGSTEVSYQYIQAEQCQNRIHIICFKCGKTFHLKDETAEQLQADIYMDNGFELDRHKSVLYGLCRDCSKDSDNSGISISS